MNLPLVIDAAELNTHLSDAKVVIIDLSSPENYAKGHVPGAINLATSRLQIGTGDVPNKAPTDEQIIQLCRDIGLTQDTQIVAYDDQKGPWAGRLIWILNMAGHNQCSLLNGQLGAWIDAGFSLETHINQAQESSYSAPVNRALIANVDYIIEHLNDPEHCIWDARSKPEYTGEKVINAKKGGHIPGAHLFEWTDCLIGENDLRLKPREQLLKDLSEQHIYADKTVITHCQTHRRSGLTYIVARHLGFNDIRCYDGSWFEWGNLTHTPVEK